MKIKLLANVLCMLSFIATAEEKKAPSNSETNQPAAAPPSLTETQPPKAKVDEKKLFQDVSYAVGMGIAKNWKMQSVEFDTDEVARAMKDVLAGRNTRLDDKQSQEAITAYQEVLRLQQSEKAARTKKEGEAFLAENKKKANVKTTASGLQYQVLKEGSGKIPASTNIVAVHYMGTLINGISFDSSYNREQPAEFAVTGVIKGWTEALQMMKAGSKWKLFIPPDLAYGENSPPNIPANSVLIFEMELLEVKNPPVPPPLEPPNARSIPLQLPNPGPKK